MNLITRPSQLGYGVVGMNVLKALVKAGRKVSLWSLGQPQTASKNDAEIVRTCMENALAYDPTAPCLRIWHQNDMYYFVGKGPRIGYTFFEGDQITKAERHQLACLDKLYLPSQWAVDVTGLNAAVAEPGVDTSIFSTACKRHPSFDKVVKKETTVFLNCGKWEVRKNHVGVLETFNKAFGPKDDVLLIMNCYNPCLEPWRSQEWSDYYMNSELGRAGKIIVLKERLETQEEVAQLMQVADCGYFPSLSEGWGLETAEMLAMGKYIITTNYSAHTQYCDAENAKLIEITETEPAYDGVFFFGERGNWAKFNQDAQDQAIQHLRALHADKQSGKLRFNQAGYDLFQRLTWANTANKLTTT